MCGTPWIACVVIACQDESRTVPEKVPGVPGGHGAPGGPLQRHVDGEFSVDACRAVGRQTTRLVGLPRDPAGHQEDPRQGSGTRSASSHQTRADHESPGGRRGGGGRRRRRRVCSRTHGNLLENAYKKQHAPTQGHTQTQAESPTQAGLLGPVTGRRLGTGIGGAHSQYLQEQRHVDLEQRQDPCLPPEEKNPLQFSSPQGAQRNAEVETSTRLERVGRKGAAETRWQGLLDAAAAARRAVDGAVVA